MNTPTKTLIAALVIALTAGGSAAFAVSTVTGAGGLRSGDSLTGCFNPSTGTLSLSVAGHDCAGGTVPVVWQTSGSDEDQAQPEQAEPEKGEPGAPGATGAPGAVGSTGATGAQGARGATGATGSAGAPGAKGEPGVQGATGAKGETGDAGEPGLQGEKGDAGEPGAQGVQGEKGEQGLKGDQGDRGEKGDAGAHGATGSVPWTAIAEWSATSTYTAGPPASLVSFQGSSYVAARSSLGASPSASPSDWILVASAGAKGEQGEQGEQGEPGVDGAPGAPGTDGAPGAKGEQGDQGIQGVQGVPGVTGLAGQDGQDGVTPWQFMGEYDAATMYTGVAPASVVQYEGSSYVAIKPEPFASIDPTDATAWSLLAASGAKGEQGETGLQGPAGTPGVPGLQGPAGNSLLSGYFGQRTGNGSETGHSTRECVLGEIMLAGFRSPWGMGVPAKGQILPISQNTALYSLFGTTYGGDGITTFGLPDLRPVAPNDMTYFVCASGYFPQGS